MDRGFEWTKSIEHRPRNIYCYSYRDVIRLYEQHKLCDKRIDEYNSRRKRNATNMWPNQWLHQRDSKYRINLCMDRRLEWTKSIECRPRNLYSNSNRNGIGLYIQH